MKDSDSESNIGKHMLPSFVPISSPTDPLLL